MTQSPLQVVDHVDSNAPDPREFFRVSKLVPLDQDVLSVSPGTAVHQALTLMDEHGFSQLPVVAGNVVIGVFTHRSLANGLSLMRSQDNPLDSPVDDFVEDLSFFRATDEVGEILPYLDRDGAVLIGEESNLIAVATATDVIDFLWESTRPFVLLQDIELAIRDLIRAACPSIAELAERVRAALDHGRDVRLAALEELTMGELLTVVLHGPNFGECFRSTFGANRMLVQSQLEPTREIRNKAFHFRGEVTSDELNVLVAARRWLLRKVLMVQST